MRPPPLRLDAVVTDDAGHAIVGLRASDFEVREDGAIRPVSLAEFRKVPRNSPVEVRPIDTRADEERAVREPGTRVFAFFLDEFHVAAGASADRAREAVSSFVDDKVYARDLVAVARALDSPASIRFTRDRGLVHGSIGAFSGRKGTYSPRTPVEERRIGRDPAAAAAARQRVVVEGLRDLAVRLGELKADRAVVVLVSEGFPRHTPPDDGSVPVLESVVHASSRSHFSICTFNPATARVGDDPRREAELSTLQWLAAETGGS